MGGYLMLKLADEGVIYARVSSAKQVAQGNGIPSQISACQFFAKEHDIKIIRIFKEPAKSGKTLERPSLKELINFLEERKKLIYVIVDDLDRLTREKEHYYPLKEIITLNKGIPIDIKGHINNDDDPYKGFLEHSMVGFADLWRRVNKARVMERQAERLKAGYWVFPTPIGYIHDENKELGIESDKAPLIRKIYEDFAAGRYKTYKEIKDSDEAKLLINPKTNTSYRFKDDSVKRMLTNKLYMGKIEFEKWGINEREGNHEAIIDESTFSKVQLLLKKKGTKKHTKIASDEFPLKGDLVCGNCKSTLVYSKSTGRSKKRYPHYRCNSSRETCDTKPKNIQTEKIHKEYLQLLTGASIHPKILKLADRVLEDIYKEQSDHLRGIQRTKRSRINELTKKRDKYIKKLINSENENIIEALEKEINKIDLEISNLESQEENTEHLESFKLHGIKLLENPKECWINGNYDERKMIFDFVFEKPLEIAEGKIGTAPYALPYSLLARKEIQKEGMVELAGIEPATSCMPCKRSPS